MNNALTLLKAKERIRYPKFVLGRLHSDCPDNLAAAKEEVGGPQAPAKKQQRGTTERCRVGTVEWSYDNRHAVTTWELFMSSARRIHLAASFSGHKASASASALKKIVCLLEIRLIFHKRLHFLKPPILRLQRRGWCSAGHSPQAVGASRGVSLGAGHCVVVVGSQLLPPID